MSIELIDVLKQKNSADFAILEDQDLKGGLRAVADLTARDAIPSSRRVAGMLVSVVSDGILYRLGAGLTNGDWEEYAPSSTAISAWKDPVEVATLEDANWTSAVSLSYVAPTLTISGLEAGVSLGVVDGYEPSVDDRVLVKDAGTAFSGADEAMDGIWRVTGGSVSSLELVRAVDANTADNINGAMTSPLHGTQEAKLFIQTSVITTLDTDDVVWAEVGSAGDVPLNLYADAATLLADIPFQDTLGYAEAEARFYHYSVSLGAWAPYFPDHTHTLSEITDAGALAALDTVATAQIDAGAVTNSELADMAAGTLKGNNTGGVTAPLDLTAAQVRTLLNVENGAAADQSAAEVPYSNATSGLTATDVQAALDEIEARVEVNDAKVTNATHSGDVSGSSTLSITNNAVTNAKLADMDQSRIKGRATVGTGDPEDLTAAQVRTILNVENGAAADQNAAEVPYNNATSGLTATDVQAAVDEIIASKGAVNGIASLDGSGKVPASQLTVAAMEYQGSWAASTNTPTLSDGGAHSTGDVYVASDDGTVDFGSGNIDFVTGDWAVYSGAIWEKVGATVPLGSVTNAQLADMPAYTIKGNNTGSPDSPVDMTVDQTRALLQADGVLSITTDLQTVAATDNRVVLASVSPAADMTLTLPDATAVSGKVWTVKNTMSANALELKTQSSQTIDGVDYSVTGLSMVGYESVSVVSDGANWFII